jgi:hypothetical protein
MIHRKNVLVRSVDDNSMVNMSKGHNNELEIKMKEYKVESNKWRMGENVEWETKTNGNIFESNIHRMGNKDKRK